ncbi:hypothetical protein LEL_09451 [Akanthomyces lecanii RCEF 1005]|uniref:Uncharacterized protein n=1 Tax=Akanthomyces lecanii RCEF 1005 TaxID=1081108 RepID=A0A168C2N4_CORDF|nr:hypothetical protein LEL_09451 [Akanthomyces lecanii RCEF 1005]
MQFTSTLLAIATMLAVGDACKCFQGANIQFGVSHGCCDQAGGRWTGDDCAFAGTGGNLGTFNSCCGNNGGNSDC